MSWPTVSMGQLCTIESGASNTIDAIPSGPYHFFDRSKQVKRSARYLYNCEALIVPGEGKEFLPTHFEGKFDLHQRAYALHTFRGIKARYLAYYLDYRRDYLPSVAVGATVKSLRRRHFTELPVVVAPLPEQQRIIAILDEAFEGIATVTANSRASNDSVADTVRDLVERALLTAEDGWTLTTVGAVCPRMEYGTAKKSQPDGRWPVLRMGNIVNGEIDWRNLVFTDDEADAKALRLLDGDVLFNRTNSLEHVGKAAIFRGDREAIFAGYLIRLRHRRDVIDPAYLNAVLNSRSVRAHGRSVAGKSVNQANISGSKLKTYQLHLPPLGRQVSLMSFADELGAEAKQAERVYQAKLTALAALKQSLLHQAFTGRL